MIVAIKTSSIKHISDLNNTLQLWTQNSFAADDSVPDTKHRVHEFIAIKLKLAKSQQVDDGLLAEFNFWMAFSIALTFVAQISYQNILKNYLKHDLRTIPSQKMYNLISDSIYGGRCEVFKRHAEESDGVIMGLDENNLYWWAMMQKLPNGNMKLHTDRAYCTNLMDVLKNVSKKQQQLPHNQSYMYGVIHKLNQVQDPYQFTGFVRLVCTTHRSRESPPRTSHLWQKKVQLDESVQVSGYMDYLRSQLKTKHNKTRVTRSDRCQLTHNI
ncbi:hypothetical protein PROFUN_16913 [Planoprotostelium fungivorum]|uniref:DNA-directed DNA polymerase n=1 Tax=Planoprotostelium fungivorum TaxID=1890364 RepID=A0A2P6MNF2_9EUKA|nr:hypothetical protein PROFUN_16913 [Planoprotostelium fungivorum]